MVKKPSSGIRQTWVQIIVLPLSRTIESSRTIVVVLGKFPNHSEPRLADL